MTGIILKMVMRTAVKQIEGRPNLNPLVEIRRLLDPSDEELALLMRTGIRTVYRWLDSGAPPDHLPLVQIRELLDLAKLVIKPDQIAAWFHEPNRTLGGFVPIRLILDPQGQQMVRDELGSAAHGLPA